jgi:hypothetical protein
MFIYCRTEDSLKTVGEAICRANFVEEDEHFWKVNDEGEFFTIETNLKDTCVAVIYRIGSFVVGVEVDDNCACKIIEPLIEIYGFEKVKWLSTK